MESQAKKVKIDTISTMIVARALISGDNPRRTLEKMSIGSVVESGPAIKLVITKSSIDMVNDSRNAATSAGIMAGKITAKNKSQSAEYEDFDFSGTTIETTEFDKRFLKTNISITEKFIKELMHIKAPRKSSYGSAYIFDDIMYRNIKEKFLSKYKLYEKTGSSQKIKYFCEWMDKLEDESLYQNWNIALIDKSNKNTVWEITDKLIVGKVSRSRKNNANKNVIDIGSLRSGRDALCDLPEEKKDQEKKNEE